jgi:SAM-dependent methyltransferase
VSASDARLDQSIVAEQRAWRSAESLDYYRRHRQGPDDLYPSERFFLPEVAGRVGSMLDVGCAAGGFSAIVKTFNPAIRYVGIDVVPEFVDLARSDHPDAEFAVGDGVHFETPPGSFELVHASGVLHLNLRFRDMLQAMWAQTRRYMLCDLRLSPGQGGVGRMESPFGERDGVPLPYVVLNVDEAIDLFRQLDPQPDSVRVKGYRHQASDAARLADPDVIMAFFLAEKGSGGAARTEWDVDVDLDVR